MRRLPACLLLALAPLGCTEDSNDDGYDSACLTLGCGGDDLTSSGEDSSTGDTATGDTATSDTAGDTTTTDTTTTTTTGGEQGCNPLMIDCAVVGETCTWDGSSFHCAQGMTKLGDSCVPGGDLGCVSGFCAPQAEVPGCPSTHCCAGFCNLDMPYCSFPGTSCVSYFPPGATEANVGACIQ